MEKAVRRILKDAASPVAVSKLRKRVHKDMETPSKPSEQELVSALENVSKFHVKDGMAWWGADKVIVRSSWQAIWHIE